jgi:hypothetical protein
MFAGDDKNAYDFGPALQGAPSLLHEVRFAGLEAQRLVGAFDPRR